MDTRILIVDDDPLICRQLEDLYTSQQYLVSSAGNASEALRLLGEHDFPSRSSTCASRERMASVSPARSRSTGPTSTSS